ncbi:hypothetical protein ACFVYA_27110 [Amycolatopsis sp. NPDC058278]|uniref:hypothetical protein n=1 Tax=Amycolatopsis sp. NPDC058278 TaxID=3346417 RepID=UPI0036DD0A1A
MLKKIGFVTAAMAAGAFLAGGVAAAATPDGHDHHHGGHTDQLGLLNLNNTDVLHNVNAALGVCDNEINVLGVQVPIQNSLNGIGVPILSPGEHEASGENPENCASSGLADGGTSQGH